MGACTGKNKNTIKVTNTSPQVLDSRSFKETPAEIPQINTVKMKLHADYLKTFNENTTDHFCYITKQWYCEWVEFSKTGILPPLINNLPSYKESDLMYVSQKDWQFLIDQFPCKYQIVHKENKIQAIEKHCDAINVPSITQVVTPAKPKLTDSNALNKPPAQYYNTSLKKPQNNFISPIANEPQSPKSNSKYIIKQCLWTGKHQ
jgi:hypothetical protein